MNKLLPISLLSASLLATTGSVFAQNPQDASRNQDLLDSVRPANLKSPRPTESGSQAAPSTSAEDTGVQEILVKAPEFQRFTFSATSNYSWETNPGFAAASETKSAVFAQSATLRWMENFGDNWLWDLSVQELVYRYDELDTLDFDRTSLKTNLAYAGLLTSENPVFGQWIPTIGAEWYRLNSGGDFGEEILQNTSLNVGLYRVFNLAEQQKLVTAWTSAWSLDSSVPASQRDEHALTLAWQATWAPRWESTVIGQAAVYDYQDRADLHYTAGVQLEYVPRPWLRVGLAFTFTENASDQAAFDYQNSSVGASLNFRFSF